MNSKYKQMIMYLLMVIFGVLIIFRNNSPKDELFIKYKINNDEKKWLLNNSERTLLVQVMQDDLKFYSSEGNTTSGIYSTVFDFFNKSVINTRFINPDTKVKSDIYVGPEYLFDDSKYIKTIPFYQQIYYMYTRSINNIYDIEDKVIGELKSLPNYNIEKVIPNGTYNVKKYETMDELENALNNNEVDGIILEKENLTLNSNKYVKCLPISSLSTSYVIAIPITQSSELSNIIRSFTSELANTQLFKVNLNQEINEYYYNNINFSLFEQEWLKNNSVVRFGVKKQNEPYSILNGDEFTGIIAEVLSDMSQMLNINFELMDKIEDKNWEDVLNACDSGEITFIPFIGKTKRSEEMFEYSNPVSRAEMVIVSKGSNSYINSVHDLEYHSVILPEYDFTIDKIMENTTDVNVRYKEDLYSILVELENDYSNYSIMDLMVLNHYIKNDKIQNMNLLGKIDSNNYYFAVNEQNKDFVTILNKILPLIDINKHYYTYSVVSDGYYDYSRTLIIILLLLIILLALILYISRIIKDYRESKRIKSDIIKANAEYNNIIKQMLEMLENASMVSQKDSISHLGRVVVYCEIIAREYGLDEKYIKTILQYATLHDIGNIGVDNMILNKEGRLTEEEYNKVKEHVEKGYDLVNKLEFGTIAENIVLYHHERWDGKGYPLGLKGEEIPVEARVVNIADTYDVLRMNRPYKQAYSHQQALDIIIEEREKQFDPKLVDIFVKYNKVFENYYDLSFELKEKLK